MGLLTPGRIYPGSTVRIAGEFLDTSDTDTDPTVSIVFKWRDPCGTETTYTYLTDAAVQKVATGSYTADVRPVIGGRHLYRWEAQSLLTAVTVYVAGEGVVPVQRSQFDGYSDNWVPWTSGQWYW